MVDLKAYPVLCVDDEPANLVTMQYVLEGQFTVLATTSAAEGIRWLRERADIAVLLADQRMPEMTGAELCAEARALRPDVARVIVTAYADLHQAMEAINLGQVSRYLTKPWDAGELVDLLRTTIELVSMQRTMRELEARLLQASSTTATGAVAREIGHELSNPVQAVRANLAVVGSFLEALARNPDPERAAALLVRGREAFADAVTALEHVEGLVRKLGARPLSRPPPPPGGTDVARIVETTLRIARVEAQKVASIGVVVEDTPWVTLDTTSLCQVVLNLVINAAQSVARAPGEDHRITVRIASEGGGALIEVTDTGAGIDAGAMERIFDPSFTTRAGGSGFGLAIVRNLLRQDGGTIHAANGAVRGATFTVRLPKMPG